MQMVTGAGSHTRNMIYIIQGEGRGWQDEAGDYGVWGREAVGRIVGAGRSAGRFSILEGEGV